MIPLRYKIKRLWCCHKWLRFVKTGGTNWQVCPHCLKIIEVDTLSVLQDVNKISEGDETLSSVPSPSTALTFDRDRPTQSVSEQEE